MIDSLSSFSSLETGLWTIFFATASLAIVLGLILAYHWFMHGHNSVMSIFAICAYSTVSFLLLSAMVAAITLSA